MGRESFKIFGRDSPSTILFLSQRAPSKNKPF